MKTYVITLSRVFPAYHPKRGTPTDFYAKIVSKEKIHTIRANNSLWKKRIEDVNSGLAILSVREWTGKPYNSPQKELCQFNKDSGIGTQSVWYDHIFDCWIVDSRQSEYDEHTFSKNDGLDLQDFKDWFKKAPKDPMAIIHFTDFRY